MIYLPLVISNNRELNEAKKILDKRVELGLNTNGEEGGNTRKLMEMEARDKKARQSSIPNNNIVGLNNDD